MKKDKEIAKVVRLEIVTLLRTGSQTTSTDIDAQQRTQVETHTGPDVTMRGEQLADITFKIFKDWPAQNAEEPELSWRRGASKILRAAKISWDMIPSEGEMYGSRNKDGPIAKAPHYFSIYRDGRIGKQRKSLGDVQLGGDTRMVREKITDTGGGVQSSPNIEAISIWKNIPAPNVTLTYPYPGSGHRSARPAIC